MGSSNAAAHAIARHSNNGEFAALSGDRKFGDVSGSGVGLQQSDPISREASREGFVKSARH